MIGRLAIVIATAALALATATPRAQAWAHDPYDGHFDVECDDEKGTYIELSTLFLQSESGETFNLKDVICTEDNSELETCIDPEQVRYYLACGEDGLTIQQEEKEDFSEGMSVFCSDLTDRFAEVLNSVPAVQVHTIQCDPSGNVIPEESLTDDGYLDQNGDGEADLDELGEPIKPPVCGCDEFGDNVTGFLVDMFEKGVDQIVVPMEEYSVDWQFSFGHNLFGYSKPTPHPTVNVKGAAYSETHMLRFNSETSDRKDAKQFAPPLIWPGGRCVAHRWGNDFRSYKTLRVDDTVAGTITKGATVSCDAGDNHALLRVQLVHNYTAIRR